MSLKQLIIASAVFGAGVLSSNTVRHGLASLRANEPIPVVSVRYASDGAYVNGNKVYEHRIGEPRCDWMEIAPEERMQYSLSELQHNRQLLGTYLRDAPTDDQKHIAYLSLLQLARKAGTSVAAEVDSMRSAIGYRWDVHWDQFNNLVNP